MELSKVDHMARRIQSGKNLVVQAADREMLEAKSELVKYRQDLESLDLTVAELKSENTRLTEENINTKAEVKSKQGDLLRLGELLDMLEQQKKMLTNKVTTLQSNEKELVLENERFKNRPGSVNRKSKAPSRSDLLIRSIEEERDHYREQTEVLEKMLRRVTLDGGSLDRFRPTSRSPNRLSSGSINRALSSMRVTSSDEANAKTIAKYAATIESLEEDRDFYKKEYELLEATRISLLSSASKDFADDIQVSQLKDEKEEMRIMLDNLNKRMTEVQSNMKLLTTEKDMLRVMYDQTRDELKRTRRDIIRSSKSQRTALAAQTVLRRVENERDDARSDLNVVTTDRDNLRERLKVATASALSEKVKLEQKIGDLKMNIDTVDAARGELLNQVTDNNSQMEERITELIQDNSQVKNEAARLNIAITALEKERESLQLQVEEKEKIIHELKQHTSAINAELVHNGDTLEIKNKEMLSLQRQLKIVSEELDEMSRGKQMVLLENNHLQDLVSARDMDNRKLKLELQNITEEKETLTSKVRRAEGFMEVKEKEIVELSEQCDILSTEAKEMEATIDELESNCHELQKEILMKDTELHKRKERMRNLEKGTHELNILVEAMKRESKVLRTQFSTERETLKDMENCLQSNNEKEFQSQLAIHERNAEVHMLKDQLALSESKMYYKRLCDLFIRFSFVRMCRKIRSKNSHAFAKGE
ncbi:hypothetical protein ScPMuIL_010844 [Solemya velum]